MKKALGFLKNNILIFIGVLLLLLFLNYLAIGGTGLALGIFATVTAAYYITIGILGIFIGDKFSAQTRKIFDVIAVCLFVLFMLLSFIFTFVNMIQNSADQNNNAFYGPTSWFVTIFGLLASLALAAFYPVTKFVNKDGLKKLCYLFAALFALGLLLDILFDFEGFAITLGQIPFMYLAVDLLFVFYLFETLNDANGEAKAAKEKEDK